METADIFTITRDATGRIVKAMTHPGGHTGELAAGETVCTEQEFNGALASIFANMSFAPPAAE